MIDSISEEEIINDAISKLKALESKLQSIQTQKSTTINIFEAVGMTTQEIKHSAFLAWLLNPAMPHNLGNKCLKALFENLLHYEQNIIDVEGYLPNKQILGVTAVEELQEFLDDKELSIITERTLTRDDDDGRIDIFIESDKAKTLIAIENKVFTSTHNDQLKRYVTEFDSREDWKKIFIYLTPNGDLPYDSNGKYEENWCILSYETILDMVRSILTEVHNTKLKNLMGDYIEMVNTNILNKNPKVRSLCKKIKREHAEALEILAAYTDNAQEVLKYAFNWCKKHIPNITQMKEGKSSFEFCTDNFEKFFTKFGQPIVTAKNNLILRFSCGYNETIALGISLQKESNEQWNTAEKLIIDTFAPNKMNSDRYVSLRDYSVVLVSAKDRDADIDKLNLDDKLNEFAKKLKDFEINLLSL